MSEYKIFENPGNKASRLERENAQLRAENRALRDALGDAHVMVPAGVSTAPAIDQAAGTFTMPGGSTVTIGRKAGGGRPSAIPSLEQAQPVAESQDGATTVQIFNAAAGPAPATVAAQPAITRPTVAAAGGARRMTNGQPAAAGGGMAQFDLGAMRPVPVQPRPPAPAQPRPPVTPSESLDDARQRFELLELDGEAIQQTGTGNK